MLGRRRSIRSWVHVAFVVLLPALLVTCLGACGGVLTLGQADGGGVDGGPDDAGRRDARVADGGPSDGGVVDAGAVDAGAVDAGAVDAGAVDAGADAGPPTIAGVSWACSSLVTGAAGSDLWPITWSDDGNQYAAWGDGNGFASARYGYGISRLAGSPSSFTGTDRGTFSPGGNGGKVAGIISIGGVLYMTRNDQDGSADNHHSIVKSTDKGRTVTATGVGFPVSGAPAMVVGPIVNFGRDNADAIDGYVYITGADWGAPSPTYLLRVPVGSIETQSAYEVFSGTSSSPAWSHSFGNRRPVFSDGRGSSDNGALKTVITYIAPLRQFILTYPSADDLGIWKMYRSPNVYGPWTLVASYTNWCGHAGEATGEMLMRFIAPAWTSSDGSRFWLVFSGTGSWDRFNAVKGTFTLH